MLSSTLGLAAVLHYLLGDIKTILQHVSLRFLRLIKAVVQTDELVGPFQGAGI